MRVGQRVVLVKDDPPALQAGEQGVGFHSFQRDFVAVQWDGPPTNLRHSCNGLTTRGMGWWTSVEHIRPCYTDPLHESIQAYIQKELAL